MRSKEEIRAEILRITKNGAIKTRIVYKTYLNFKNANQHITKLIKGRQLIQQGKRYFTTKTGLNYIRYIKKITKIIRSK